MKCPNCNVDVDYLTATVDISARICLSLDGNNNPLIQISETSLEDIDNDIIKEYHCLDCDYKFDFKNDKEAIEFLTPLSTEEVLNMLKEAKK